MQCAQIDIAPQLRWILIMRTKSSKKKPGSNRVNLRSERDVCTGNTLDTELSAREHEMMWNILWIRKLQKKNDFLFSLRAQYSIGTLEIYFQRIKSSFKITIQLQKKSSPTLKCINIWSWRKRGSASNPKMEYQVLSCIFH